MGKSFALTNIMRERVDPSISDLVKKQNYCFSNVKMAIYKISPQKYLMVLLM